MVMVIKVGDRILEQALSLEGLADLQQVSTRTKLVLVHGGGNTVTRIAEQLGIPQRFVFSPEGFRSRYTDSETIHVYTMVMAGRVNKEVVQRLQAGRINAVGLSGLDGGLIRADRKERLVVRDERGRRRVVDGGYTGRITSVNSSILQTLLAAGYVPVVAPVASGALYEPLNVDGDRAAAHIAAAIQAEILLLVTDVDGISTEAGLVRTLRAEEAKRSLPRIGPGMVTKTYAALEAISMGVGRAVIAPGAVKAPFSSALANQQGTLILA